MPTRIFQMPSECLGRSFGLEIKQQICNVLQEHHAIEISFDAVTIMSPGFADECFGKLAEKMGRTDFMSRIKLSSNSIDATTRQLINTVLGNRLT